MNTMCYNLTTTLMSGVLVKVMNERLKLLGG